MCIRLYLLDAVTALAAVPEAALFSKILIPLIFFGFVILQSQFLQTLRDDHVYVGYCGRCVQVPGRWYKLSGE